MYQHIVFFKFRENSPSDAIQHHMDMFAALKDAIPQIVSYAGGVTFPGGEGQSKFDTAHYLTYQTKEDIDIYIDHAAHQEFVEANKAHWKDVLVIDAEITSA